MDSLRNKIRTRVRTTLLAIWCCLPLCMAGTHLNEMPSPKRITYPVAVWSHDQLQEFHRKYMEQQHFDRQQLACMALTVYGENRGHTTDGVAVAFVVMNRIYNPGYPGTPCEVVLQRNQIEPLGKGKRLRKYAVLALDGKPTKPESITTDEWVRLKRIASQAYYSSIPDPTNGATHFWSPVAQRALGRKPPSWSRKYTHVASFGGHQYYLPIIR